MPFNKTKQDKMTFAIVYIKFVFQGCATTTYVYRTRGNGFTGCEIPYFS